MGVSRNIFQIDSNTLFERTSCNLLDVFITNAAQCNQGLSSLLMFEYLHDDHIGILTKLLDVHWHRILECQIVTISS